LYRKEMPQHQSGADLQTKRIYKEVQLWNVELGTVQKQWGLWLKEEITENTRFGNVRVEQKDGEH
jgi:hypothetical protein